LLALMAELTAAAIAQTLRNAAPRNVLAWRVLRQRWSRALKDQQGKRVVEIAVDLVESGFWGRVTGYELIAHHPGALSALTPAAVEQLARGLSDWASVDTFACYVAGPAWRDGRLPTRQVHAWLRSEDRWLRRTGVVCTVALNVRARGGSGDVARTLSVCKRVVADRDDMVVKALSWALRALVEWDRAAVAGFLMEHDADVAARVKREVRTKLRTGRKNAPKSRN
jgi:3-methyladenine DNA glycosylase AlkD